MNRRDFLKASAAIAALPVAGCVAQPLRAIGLPYVSAIPEHDAGLLVNDVHSQLNATRVASIVKPRNVDELQAGHRRGARAAGRSVSIAGGRHAMGGQQFGEAGVLVDTRALNRVLAFDAEHGVSPSKAASSGPRSSAI